MKKILAMAIGLAAVASIAYAAEVTYSQNAVGFISKTVEADKLYALTMPFDNMASDDGSWKFADLQLAQDAEIGSMVYFWDGTGWTPYNKNFLGQWTCGDYQLKPGECFFFKPADATPVVMAGQVPDSETTPVAVAGQANLSAVGNPYPVSMVFAESALAQGAEIGAMVYFWDGSGWTPYNKNFLGQWTCGDQEVQPGDGFFFKTTEDESSSNWEAEKAYDWP